MPEITDKVTDWAARNAEAMQRAQDMATGKRPVPVRGRTKAGKTAAPPWLTEVQNEALPGKQERELRLEVEATFGKRYNVLRIDPMATEEGWEIWLLPPTGPELHVCIAVDPNANAFDNWSRNGVTWKLLAMWKE